jgi:hypothetical protein
MQRPSGWEIGDGQVCKPVLVEGADKQLFTAWIDYKAQAVVAFAGLPRLVRN